MNHLPHTNVVTRLRNSPIHGIGVFAICDIQKGSRIFPNDPPRMNWIAKSEIDSLPLDESIRAFYRDFCILRNGKYGCPEGFDILPASWYLNGPNKGGEPNVVCDANDDFFAARDIAMGEELTVDYSTFCEQRRY